ncbi:J domain-containing protein [Telmatospirillum sp.]|uniref:J domain-containing protein n=1 Tax=Telmatospirillum sp. TaxID=2079197 RepID=UPI002847027D|nr:J domain-containing protein [Telmatospirillum sp.]MDR3436949.1 J domain-containing protein [Telmatospirillum sp.]
MTKDPYQILGVEKTATADELRTAYRTLAKRHHPDLNPGKPAAEEAFKAISVAYDLLSDPEKRARFDRGEIDAAGTEQPAERRYYRDFGDDPNRPKYRSDAAFDADDFDSVFGHMFGDHRHRGFSAGGEDAHYALAVSFLDAANGAVRRLTLPDGSTLDVTIPAGLKNGQILRLKGKGQAGQGDEPPGDALIEVSVAAHHLFRREGNDVVIELPISFKEAILGAKVAVPTIKGPVSLTIPPNSSTGRSLRLKGRGISGGNQRVELKIVLAPETDPDLDDFLKTWNPRQSFDPRAGMKVT